MSKLTPPNLAGRFYLDLYTATNYPEQEPQYQCAKWYDLLWLLVPIVGIIPFTMSIEERWTKMTKDKS